MKKSIIMAVLGVAASAASSYGQGVIFSSYTGDGGAGIYTYLFGTTTTIPAGFKADLYYFVGDASDPVTFGSSQSVTSAVGGGLIDLGVVGVTYNTLYEGYEFFQGPAEVIPGYSSGDVTLEIVAFNGSTYASSSIRGRSGSFTMTSISAAPTTPSNSIGDNGPGAADFYVAAVPEPTTLALAGLGGLASLVAFRRKQA